MIGCMNPKNIHKFYSLLDNRWCSWRRSWSGQSRLQRKCWTKCYKENLQQLHGSWKEKMIWGQDKHLYYDWDWGITFRQLCQELYESVEEWISRWLDLQLPEENCLIKSLCLKVTNCRTDTTFESLQSYHAGCDFSSSCWPFVKFEATFVLVGTGLRHFEKQTDSNFNCSNK